RLLVCGGLHAVHADVVPEHALPGSSGIPAALAHDLCESDHDAAHAGGRRGGPAHADPAGNGSDVPLTEGAAQADGDGALPARIARVVALRRTDAPRRAPRAHSELV